MDIKTLSNVKLKPTESEEKLYAVAQKSLHKTPKYFRIVKKSLDARDKNAIRYIYTIEFSAKEQTDSEESIARLPSIKQPQKPVVVVGSGPAGLFCALRLLERGIIPVLIERGDEVDKRKKKINEFSLTGKLDTESNVQFGEGGAGTFSDGKLNTGTHTGQNGKVYKTFVKFGAPSEILYVNKPHIGSDNLQNVVKNIRNYILQQGGRVAFNCKLTDILMKDGKVEKVQVNGEHGEEIWDVSAVVLAVGHSARDTFEMLVKRGVPIIQKDFAIGARMEHLQEKISLSQYGEGYSLLPAADYKLVSHASDRATFSFCMCPGGYVMPAASEEGGVVTNGMSNYRRDGKNANSALIVQVSKADYQDEGPLSGMYFQRELERKAFLVGGKNYKAPVQRIGDFLEKKPSTSFGEVLPTYPIGHTFVEMDEVLPPFVCESMRLSLLDMDKRLKGIASPDGILTGVETRTSSPVRILRDERMQSVGVENLFPCGEGAGYAGGITSSAVDGIRVADAIFEKFA